MEDNQINGQKISKEAYCPNSFFDNGTISIGEFKTLDDAMNFPIKEIWCINRTEDNKFQSYKSQGSRLLIICSWNRSIQDSLKFVVAVIHKDKVGKVYYWDMNDLPLYPEERKNQYEGSLGDDATYTLYQIANNRLNCNTNMNKKLVRLTESDLHRIVKESVNRVLKEDWELASGYDELKNDISHATDDAYNSTMEHYREILKKWIPDEREYATVTNIIFTAIQKGLHNFFADTSTGNYILKTMRR